MNIEFTELSINKTYYNSPEKCSYIPTISFSKEQIEMSFNFAYDMTFGNKGEHRDHRSGGTSHRKNGEIFANAFQGKLAEIGFKEFIEEKYGKGILSEPDMSCSELGIWDACDFLSKHGPISVKSTKHYSGLLLLETKDWDSNGCYIPNKHCKYYLIALVRLGFDLDDVLKGNRLLYSEECDKEFLKKVIHENISNWDCDFPGFIYHEDLLYIINKQRIIKKGDFLNKTEMDATNYYVKANDLRKWKEKKNGPNKE